MYREKTGWLVNDRLTCIPNTKTFWHFLLDTFPKLQDKTSLYTPFEILSDKIENEFQYSKNKPDYIIRNATYFRKLNLDTKIISLLQDPSEERSTMFYQQVDVCNGSDYVVYNSEYTKNRYKSYISTPSSVIEIGTDSNLFKPLNYEKQKNTIIYVGSSDEYHKGFSLVLKLIEKTNYNFILVMKDGFTLNHERVRVFNSITQEELVKLLNLSDLLICTSKNETLHLAGIEAAFCNVPIIASDVGIYNKIKHDKRWGMVVDEYSLDCYINSISFVLQNNAYEPRKSMFDNHLSINDCRNSWKKLITNI